MTKTKLTVKFTTQFKKNDKLAIKRRLEMELLDGINAVNQQPIWKDVAFPMPGPVADQAWSLFFSGSASLMARAAMDNVLVLTLARTGTHSDLFVK